jgi:hypothetical protein
MSEADIGLFKHTLGVLADRIVYLIGTCTPQRSYTLWQYKHITRLAIAIDRFSERTVGFG